VRCTRLNNRQPDALNDEKIICHPRRKLVKTEMPGLAPGIFILRVALSGGDRPSQEGASAEDLRLVKKTGTIPAHKE
jgi:hypothetical protein